MQSKNSLTNLLAIFGTLLVWFPTLLPVLVAALSLIEGGDLRFDYLLPAEYFPIALLGGLLLIWAAWRAHLRLRWISWSLAAALGFPVFGQVVASLSGLASGETEPVGLWWNVVLAAFAGFFIALLFLGAGGILLLRDLYRQQQAVGR